MLRKKDFRNMAIGIGINQKYESAVVLSPSWQWFDYKGLMYLVMDVFILGAVCLFCFNTPESRNYNKGVSDCSAGKTIPCVEDLKSEEEDKNQKFFKKIYKLKTNQDLPKTTGKQLVLKLQKKA